MNLYSYDSAGNLLYDNVHHYFYDAENRLIQVDGTLPYCTSNGTSGAAATACYYYDAEGKRVHRTGYTNDTCDNTGKRGYVFDLQGRVIVETNSTGTDCDIQVYAGERHFGRQGGGSFFYHSDWHFTGKERDSESGLDNFGKRYFGSSMGRFMTPDPLLNSGQPWNPQSWNRYAYTENNPLRYTDPTGLYKFGNCSGTEEQCKADQQRFRDSIAKAKEALKGLDPNSKEAKALQKTLDKLGEGGKGNIKINFGDAGKTDGQPNLGRTVGNSITINYDAVDSEAKGFNLNASESAALDAGVTTHEGAHAGGGPSILGFVGMHGEHAAYFNESVTYQGLHNTDRPFLLWNESWLAVDQHTLEQNRENAIQNAIHPPKQPEQPKQENPQ
jgi:RHS repeat-associated protein